MPPYTTFATEPTVSGSSGGGFWNSFFNAIPAIGATVVGALQASNRSSTPVYTGVTPQGGIYAMQTPYSQSVNVSQYMPLLLLAGAVIIAVVLLKR